MRYSIMLKVIDIEWWYCDVLQMIDRLDQGLISPQVVQQSYQDLWRLVSKALFRTHVEGQLKVIASLQLVYYSFTRSTCSLDNWNGKLQQA